MFFDETNPIILLKTKDRHFGNVQNEPQTNPERTPEKARFRQNELGVLRCGQAVQKTEGVAIGDGFGVDGTNFTSRYTDVKPNI